MLKSSREIITIYFVLQIKHSIFYIITEFTNKINMN